MTGARVRWGAVAVFTVLAFTLAWLVALPLWISGEGLAHPFAGLLLIAMMTTPALAMLVVVFLLRAPATGRVAFLGLWPLRPARRWVPLMLAAWFGPIVVVLATVLAAAALGLVELDLVGFSGFAAQLEAATPAGVPLPPIGVLVAVQLALIPVGGLVNSVVAAGEELGWRGWLLPALQPLGVWPALLVSGVVWGLWHAPIILLGYNFARPDVTGVLLMVGGCVAWGVLLGWLRLRSASVWPAVLAHGSLNAVGGIVLLLAAAGETPDLAVVGPLGGVAWLVIAVVSGVIALAGGFRGLPAEPAGARVRA